MTTAVEDASEVKNSALADAFNRLRDQIGEARDAIARIIFGQPRVVEETLAMAGKTGTSQVRNITAAERARGVFRNEDLPWERRDHALFVCYAPYDDPQVAVAVVIEHGGGGSSAAAPVGRDVLLQALYDGGLPPLEAYPTSQREEIRQMQEALPLRPAPEPKFGRRSRA